MAGRSYSPLMLALSLLLLLSFWNVAQRLFMKNGNNVKKKTEQIANPSARTVAQQHHTRSHACFSARSVVLNASAFLLVLTATSKSAPATTPGRPRKEDPNALKLNLFFLSWASMPHTFTSLPFSFQRITVLIDSICVATIYF
ncbi:unnamed protein product [Sphenostylis stenocarpa]|uniref:Uncharacterized protein n=1 Tax=Sphenostylis stenocarpa TaxID=92480 RepID=A0AA86VU81_9FABA|nr:unnamed protein product [Sphenostylis stenocarpa]